MLTGLIISSIYVVPTLLNFGIVTKRCKDLDKRLEVILDERGYDYSKKNYSIKKTVELSIFCQLEACENKKLYNNRYLTNNNDFSYGDFKNYVIRNNYKSFKGLNITTLTYLSLIPLVHLVLLMYNLNNKKGFEKEANFIADHCLDRYVIKDFEKEGINHKIVEEPLLVKSRRKIIEERKKTKTYDEFPDIENKYVKKLVLEKKGK